MEIETCRICANYYVTTTEVKFVHLFQLSEENLPELDFIINEINSWKLNITPNDGLPQRICGNCFAKFRVIDEWRKECEKAQNMLRKALEAQEKKSDVNGNSSLDFSQQLYVVETNDSNEYTPENVESTVKEIVVNNADGLSQIPSDAVIVSPNFAVNYNIEYDVNMPTNIVISNGCIVATATDETSVNGNVTAAVQDTNMNIKVEPIKLENNSIIENQDLEEMLEGSIIQKNPIKQNFTKVTLKKKDSIKVILSDSQSTEYESTDNEDDIFNEKPAQRIANFAFACNYCYCPPVGPIGHLIFRNSDGLSQHFFDVHDPKFPYPCPKCSKLFTSSRRRDAHVTQIHAVATQRINRCPYCLKAIRTPLKIHELSCTYVSNWKCKVCERDFRQMPLHSFRAHQNSHYKNPKFRCEICRQDFMRSSNFETHKRMHAESCIECKEYFPSVNELRKHNATVHGGKPLFRCTYCGKDFSSFAYLERHIQNFHSHRRKRDFDATTCSNCNVTFSTKLKLHYHQQRPKDENGQCILQYSQKSRSRYFCCPHCTKRFTTKDQLDFHVEIHDARLRPYACEKCTVRCHTLFELQQHVDAVHLNITAFACDICDQRFGYKKDLEDHKLCHSKQCSFKCSMKDCNITFTTEEGLCEHFRLNHELVSCEYCNELFTPNKLKVHQKTKPCLDSINGVTSVNENTFNNQNESQSHHINHIESQIETVSSTTTCKNDNVRVQFVSDQQQSIVLKNDQGSEQIHEDVLAFLQSAADENVIHAPDVPLNDDDYFISSLLDPDNEIVVA